MTVAAPKRARGKAKLGRKCTVCSHPAREAIDHTLAAGMASLRNIAECHGLGRFAVFRHGVSHVPQLLADAAQADKVARADRLMDRLLELNRQTREILASALADQERALALKAIARLERQIELEGRLIGELQDRPTVVNLSITNEWRELRTLVFQALESHTEARLAVAAALKQHAIAG